MTINMTTDVREIKHQSVSASQANEPRPGTRPALTGEQLANAKRRSSELEVRLRTPRDFQYSRTPLLKESSLQLPKEEIALVKPEKLKLHPEIPSADTILSNFEQPGDSFLTLATLMPELAKLALSAKNEQLLVGAAV